MCRVLKVKEGSYYAWRKRGLSRRTRDNQLILDRIREIAAESRNTYGSLRVLNKLRAEGVCVNRKRITRIMRQNGLRGAAFEKASPPAWPSSQISDEHNILNRNFRPEKANCAWASDITAIPTREGWLYLSVTIDLFSRRVVGYSMDRTRAEHIVVESLKSAITHRRPPRGFIHHSDRGTQYTSHACVGLVQKYGGICSLSRKGNCWDNAVAESFFATLKRELNYGKGFATRAEARAAIFEYIETWYNRRRIHSTLGYLSPVDFERLSA
jgi:putative transposase